MHANYYSVMLFIELCTCIHLVLLSLVITAPLLREQMHNYHVSMYTELSSLLLAFYVPQDQFAATPLIAACDENKPEVARYLIQKRANVNLQDKVNNCLYYFHYFVL